MNKHTAPSQLRILAKDYADGRIQREEYLRARTAFLDALGNDGSRRNDPPQAPTRPDQLAPIPTVGKVPPSITPPSRAHRLTPLVIALGIGLMLSLSAGVGFLLVVGDEPSPRPSSQTAAERHSDKSPPDAGFVAEHASADPEVTPGPIRRATAALGEQSDDLAPGPTTPPAGLESRLPVASPGDVCTRAAAQLDDLWAPSYRCQDHLLRSTRSKGPMLAVIPGSLAPFAVTAEPLTPHELKDWWCLDQRMGCTDATDARAEAMNDTQATGQKPAQSPDDIQALARDYASWLSERTGYSYRIARPAELNEAARYGLGTGAGIRLVRELTLKQGSQEGKALERWWHYHQKGSN